MASGTFEGAFCAAVQKGNQEEWCQLLTENRIDPHMKLDLGFCVLDAVRHKCPTAVSDVLMFKPPLNAEDSQGQRAIHLAARYGPQETISLLAWAGSTLNCSNRDGWTPLHVACRYGNLDTAEKLVLHGANTNAARTEDKLTPLHIAIRHQHERIVDFLLRRGADPNTASSKRHGQVSALAMAAVGKDASVLKAFLKMALGIEYSADVNGSYPLHLAAESGTVESLRHLLSHLGCVKLTESPSGSGACRKDFQDHLPLLENQEERRLKRLLNLLDGNHRTALHLAILKNRREVLQILLDAGADVSIPYKKMLPFELATQCVQPRNASFPLPLDSDRDWELFDWEVWDDGIVRVCDDGIVRLLLERSVYEDTVTKRGDYPIHLVLSAGLYGLALDFVTNMPHKINYLNGSRETPLHVACRCRSKDGHSRHKVVRRLLELGLSVNACTDDGICPLSLAVVDGDVDLISIILSSSPDISTRDGNGFTPLHYAVRSQTVSAMEAILDARPEAIVFDDVGLSPLHMAVSDKKVKMVECLLSRNADPNHRDPVHRISLLRSAIGHFVSISSTNKSLEMVKLLVKRGVDLDTRDTKNLTPLQHMLQMALCCSMLPEGREAAMGPGLSALKLLVEAGSELQPWTLTQSGLMRRTPLQSMAYCGLLPLVYYLANAGWPLETEIPSSSTTGNTSQGSANVPRELDWVRLPGNCPAQDNLHAFLMLRNANPFSLLHLARSTIRGSLVRSSIETHGQRREIMTLISRLPVPELMKKYLCMQDWDYSNPEESWKKLLHLLPPSVADQALTVVQATERAV